MQPAVRVHGHSLAFIFLDTDGLGGIFDELQKSRDSHGCAPATQILDLSPKAEKAIFPLSAQAHPEAHARSYMPAPPVSVNT